MPPSSEGNDWFECSPLTPRAFPNHSCVQELPGSCGISPRQMQDMLSWLQVQSKAQCSAWLAAASPCTSQVKVGGQTGHRRGDGTELSYVW